MSALSDYLNKNGRAPDIALRITPLDSNRRVIEQTRFISYSFQSSILVPVDAFNFTFANPTHEGSFYDLVKEGDSVELIANGQTICTGVVDVVDIDSSVEGEIVNVSGRDLLAQLEDQSAVSIKDDPIYANKSTINSTVGALIASTKIKGLRLQNAPSGSFLFATEPGESKLSALQRFVEPLNCVFWADPFGRLVVGRPNMAQPPAGRLFIDRENRTSNVLQIKTTHASSQIPNVIVPVWTGQEILGTRVSPEQRLNNASSGPSRLRELGYLVPRVIVVSNPDGASPQGLSDVNAINQAGSSNILQSYAKRELARANISEKIVQVVVKGHFNDDLLPFLADQVYNVFNPRASVNEKMYLYSVTYVMEDQGPKTTLEFCKLGRIVADVAVSEQTPTNVPRSSLR